MSQTTYDALDAWIDAHFDEEVAFLAELVKVPTDTPPGDNAPHAERTAQLLKAFGFDAEKHPVPADEVTAYGLTSITNLIVRRRYGAGGRREGGSASRSTRMGTWCRRATAGRCPLTAAWCATAGSTGGRRRSARATSPPMPLLCGRWRPRRATA